MLISGIEFGVISGDDKGGHKSACLTLASAADEALVSAGQIVARSLRGLRGRELLVLEPSEFEHCSNELIVDPRPDQNTIPFDPLCTPLTDPGHAQLQGWRGQPPDRDRSRRRE